MPWLKFEESHAAGYGPAQYVEFRAEHAVENLKDEIAATLYDGVRTPRFEILDSLPPEVLQAKIDHAMSQCSYWVTQYEHLVKQRVQPSGS